MRKDLLEIILCPACGAGDWRLDGAVLESVEYAEGPVEEVRSGGLACACGRVYAIEEYVLSFAQLFPEDLRREAEFWNRFYIWNIEHGSLGFYDLRKGFTPFLVHGVPDPFPAADEIDRYDVHYAVAEHPTMRRGTRLLDIGVGLGWTSLHFARAGYAVTAFDPSLGPMQAAKRYAIGQGLHIEYICAAMGHIAFRPVSFDNAAAFHSLHHVPDLEANLHDLARWLAPGGGFAVDEHIRNSRFARDFAAALHHWAAENVFPRYKTISDEELATLPSEPHSEREDASADLIVPLLNRMFTVRMARRRHVFLDHYPLLYYLWCDRDMAAYRHALVIANNIQELARQVDPDGAEYVTLVVENTRPAPQIDPAPAQAVAEPPVDLAAEIAAREERIAELAAELAAVRAQLAPAAAQRDRLEDAEARAAELERILAAQSAWASSLEKAQLQKQAEVDELKRRLQRIENGRLMRLLARLGR